jgi:A/G-specific adenine glycosylase
MKNKINHHPFTRFLLTWHEEENTRTMPWKGEKDPYKIWLSEIILQQTRVEQGLNYYLEFIKHYPTVSALASAKDDDVFKLWEGLGYYSRCKNMLIAARHIIKEFGGFFPSKYDDILKLKGVGPYTAAAIASFAFNLPHAVLDGNVFRVLSRFFGVNTPIDSTEGKSYFLQLAKQLLHEGDPASYNQAIMDFGATVCTPKLPLCTQCVLSGQCEAYFEHKVQDLPVKSKKKPKKHRWFYYILAKHETKWLIRKRTGNDIWQNLHEFILIETEGEHQIVDIMALNPLKSLVRENNSLLKVSGYYKQQLTHQTIHATFIHVELRDKVNLSEMYWVSRKEMAQLAFPKLINSYLCQLEDEKISRQKFLAESL